MNHQYQEQFEAFLEQRAALNHAITILDFDAETVLPEQGGDAYSKTAAQLAGLSYSQLTNSQTQYMFEQLQAEKNQLPLHLSRELEELMLQSRRMQAISQQEYMAFKQCRAAAGLAWVTAKRTSNYALFRPYLELLIDYTVRHTKAFDSKRPLYDVLLDEYEKGLTTATLNTFFAQLKQELVPLIQQIAALDPADTPWLNRRFPIVGQQQLAAYLMQVLGLPRDRCALAQTEHPFSTATNNRDVRITTHYYEDKPLSSLFSVLHEGGHGLYMIHMADELNGLSLAEGAGCAVHESQSRLYENMVGRSRGFLSFLLPWMKEIFPEQLAGISADQLYFAANRAQPSLIRIEADELTYPLHIIIRYELEQRLLSGSLNADDLPAAWNELYWQYLGVEVPDDKHGVLQDMHWSDANFGYFPTYAVGSAYAAQIMAVARRELDVEHLLAQGQLQPLTEWLSERIFHWGGMKLPEQIIREASCLPFRPQYYTSYLGQKYRDLYGIK